MGFFGKKPTSDGTELYDIHIGPGVYFQVYDDRVSLTIVGSKNTIYYKDISAVRFLEGGGVNLQGEMEFIYPSAPRIRKEKIGVCLFTFKTAENAKYREIKDYIEKRIREIKGGASSSNTTASAADEILKLKQLLDIGAITQQEYDEQKRKLL